MRTLSTLCVVGATMILSGPVGAQQQQLTGAGQFCLKSANGPIQCQYQTLTQCEQARPAGSKEQCLNRAKLDNTVGVGQGENPTSNAESPSNPAPE